MSGTDGAPDLLPCPFCGNGGAVAFPPTCRRSDKYDPMDRAYPLVRCQDCHASASGRDWDATCQTAVKQWNMRAPSVNSGGPTGSPDRDVAPGISEGGVDDR